MDTDRKRVKKTTKGGGRLRSRWDWVLSNAPGVRGCVFGGAYGTTRGGSATLRFRLGLNPRIKTARSFVRGKLFMVTAQ